MAATDFTKWASSLSHSFIAYLGGLFDPSSGHDHDGTNSKPAAAVAAGTITNAMVNASAGIVATKLSAAVQTSLGKADSAVQSTASGKAVVAGTAEVTGTADITTGLGTVTAVVVSLRDDPALTGMWATAAPGATPGHIDVKVWKPTAQDNATPIASAAAVDVDWIAFGTPAT